MLQVIWLMGSRSPDAKTKGFGGSRFHSPLAEGYAKTGSLGCNQIYPIFGI